MAFCFFGIKLKRDLKKDCEDAKARANTLQGIILYYVSYSETGFTGNYQQ